MKMPARRRYYVGRNLTRAEAYRRARALDSPFDHRGFTYNPRTGWAVLT